MGEENESVFKERCSDNDKMEPKNVENWMTHLDNNFKNKILRDEEITALADKEPEENNDKSDGREEREKLFIKI